MDMEPCRMLRGSVFVCRLGSPVQYRRTLFAADWDSANMGGTGVVRKSDAVHDHISGEYPSLRLSGQLQFAMIMRMLQVVGKSRPMMATKPRKL